MKFILLGTVIATLLLYGLKKYVDQRHASPVRLYKIVSVEHWEQSKDKQYLVLSTMDQEFIHLATEQQLDKIIEKFWHGRATFVVVTLDVKKLPGRLVLESNPGGATKFYHLYNGAIPQQAIIESKIVNR